jgi:hypothetical protein
MGRPASFQFPCPERPGEKSQIVFKAIPGSKVRAQGLEAHRPLPGLRSSGFHRLGRYVESAVLDREEAFAPSRLLMDVHLTATILARY